MEDTINQVAEAVGVKGLTENDVRSSLEYIQALCTNPFVHLMTAYVKEHYDRLGRAMRLSSDQIASVNGLLGDLETLSRKSPNTAAITMMLQGIEDPYVIQFICVSRRRDLQVYVPDDGRDIIETYAKLNDAAAAFWPTFKSEHLRLIKRVCRFLEAGDFAITKTGSNLSLAPGFDSVMCVYSSFVAQADDNARGIKKHDRYQMRGSNPKRAAQTAQSIESAAPTETATPAESAPPAETAAPTESATPAESAPPAETAPPAEMAAPTESAPPAETAAPTESAADDTQTLNEQTSALNLD